MMDEAAEDAPKDAEDDATQLRRLRKEMRQLKMQLRFWRARNWIQRHGRALAPDSSVEDLSTLPVADPSDAGFSFYFETLKPPKELGLRAPERTPWGSSAGKATTLTSTSSSRPGGRTNDMDSGKYGQAVSPPVSSPADVSQADIASLDEANLVNGAQDGARSADGNHTLLPHSLLKSNFATDPSARFHQVQRMSYAPSHRTSQQSKISSYIGPEPSPILEREGLLSQHVAISRESRIFSYVGPELSPTVDRRAGSLAQHVASRIPRISSYIGPELSPTLQKGVLLAQGAQHVADSRESKSYSYVGPELSPSLDRGSLAKQVASSSESSIPSYIGAEHSPILDSGVLLPQLAASTREWNQDVELHPGLASDSPTETSAGIQPVRRTLHQHSSPTSRFSSHLVPESAPNLQREVPLVILGRSSVLQIPRDSTTLNTPVQQRQTRLDRQSRRY